MPRAPNTHISFDVDDAEDCKRAIGELKMVILKLYGAAAVRGLFAVATPSRREVKTDKNAFLLAEYLRHSKRLGWSVKRCAKDFAGPTNVCLANGGLAPLVVLARTPWKNSYVDK